MREEVNEMELEEINGGTVIISEDYSVIGFSTVREKYKYTCDFDTAYALYRRLYVANKDKLNEVQFDALCKAEFAKAGYIDLNQKF